MEGEGILPTSEKKSFLHCFFFSFDLILFFSVVYHNLTFLDAIPFDLRGGSRGGATEHDFRLLQLYNELTARQQKQKSK